MQIGLLSISSTFYFSPNLPWRTSIVSTVVVRIFFVPAPRHAVVGTYLYLLTGPSAHNMKRFVYVL